MFKKLTTLCRTKFHSEIKMQYCKFLEEYRKFTSGNETPELIHLWVGLTTLAGACEKRIWIDQGYFKLFLNLYTLLIAPAGVCSKSTSMGLGLKLLKECGFNVMEGAILKEKIIEELMEQQKDYVMPGNTAFVHSPVTYVSNELNVLLSTGVEMVKFLVDIYDADDIYAYKTKNSGVYEVVNPYFNLIAAAVPQWFGSSIAQDMGATGFLARCIIVYQDAKRQKVPRPVVTDAQKASRARCVEILYKLINEFGAMEMSQTACDFYDEWYMKQDISNAEDYRIAGYLERRTKIHIIKVAALMAIGDSRHSIEIVDFERAIHLMEWTEEHMRTAYIIAGGNPLASYIQQTKQMLATNNNIMSMSSLVRAFYTDLGSVELKSMIETMVEMKMVRIELKNKENYVRLLND